MELTEGMREVLADVVERFDAAILRELELWGATSATRLRGVHVSPSVKRSCRALVERGLLTIEYRTETLDTPRRGAYGRKTGGTRRWTFTSWTACPTALGRRTLATT